MEKEKCNDCNCDEELLYAFQFVADYEHVLDGTIIFETSKERACEIFLNMSSVDIKEWEIKQIELKAGVVL